MRWIHFRYICCSSNASALFGKRSLLIRQISTGIPAISKSEMGKVKKRYDDIIKSQEDKRLYRGLLLENDLKVVLISDSNTDKSAASLDVNIGFMCDPPEIPGLAHLLEHMLFLGTTKFPKENEYNKFLSEHSGSSNAFTGLDHTNYYFDVAPEHLHGALDRFAQFFVCPLFNEDATKREINAVNSEHDKNVSNDSWRLDQLDKSTSKEDHPYCHFGTGNKETLWNLPKENGINVRDELMKFHEKWYSANIMTLSILGRESLEKLEDIVLDLFSEIRNTKVVAPSWNDHPYGPEQLRYKGYVVPVKDLRNLNITFPIPDLQEYYKSGPGHYLSHLIGHEGPGSLLSALKAKGWCSNLVGGVRQGAKGFGFFVITVDLTEDGINHVDDVIDIIFQYINLLKREGPKEWIFKEYRDIMAMHFRFKDKEPPSGYVTTISQLMHDYPINEVLGGPYLLKEWRPDLVSQVLGYLRPENLRVAVIGKQFADETPLTEPWYGTKYNLMKIPDDVIQDWSADKISDELHLPDENEFIPTNFDLYPAEENPTPYPVVIQETPFFRVWYKRDDEFLLPKCNLKFEFISPLAYLDPYSCNMAYMFVTLFKDALNEFAYAAELSGLKWDLSNTKYGMELGVGGYNDKQHVLLDKIIEKMTNFKVDPKRFEILKENYIRGLKNFEAEQPYQHAVYYLAILLSENAWTKEELLAATSVLTIERVEDFVPQMLSNMFIECLVHGNTNKKIALDLVNQIEDRLSSSVALLPLLPCQLLRNREVKLVDGCNFLLNIENKFHRSSCVETYFQCNVQTTENNMVLELLSQILNEPCQNILRTKEQLGYNVFSGIRRASGVQGFRVIVQSDKHPRFVDQRIEEFLVSMNDYIRNLSQEEFVRHREALAAHRLEKPKRLGARTARYWLEINSQQYNFDRANIEVAFLRTLTKDNIIEFFENMISANSPQRHKLAVHVLSMAEGGAGLAEKDTADCPVDEEKPTVIENITKFKSSQGLFPLAQPFISINSSNTKSKL